MDGYAVIAADVTTASEDNPVTLPVDAEVAAGDTGASRDLPGHCIKIMTGALLPAGADAIVPVEWTDADGRRDGQITKSPGPRPGNAVRRAGDDAQPGDLLLPAGNQARRRSDRRAGRGRPRNGPRQAPPRTSRSSRPATSSPSPARRWFPAGSGTPTATCSPPPRARRAARRPGSPRCPTNPTLVLAAIEQAASTADLLITSGGVSMGGEHDVVKAALTKLGSVGFRKVAMQPGMPQGFGLIGGGHDPIFTLPGNPVSAFVSFCLFVLPALDALKNHSPQRQPQAQAALTMSVRSPWQAVVSAGPSRSSPGHRGAAHRAVIPPAWRARPGRTR